MNLQLRHRLILVWLGTILLAMALAAGLFMVLVLDFHQANAHSRLLAGFNRLHNRIIETSSLIRQNGKRFAMRGEIISSLSMIDRYQDPAAYQPLVFDPEKKRLADQLADLIEATGLSRAVIYSRSAPVAGFINGTPAFLSYDENGYPVLWRAEQRGLTYSRQDDATGSLQTAKVGTHTQADIVHLRRNSENATPVIEGIFPLTRKLGEKKQEIVGYLQVWRLLDKRFVDEVSRSIGLALLLCGKQLGAIGDTTLPCPPDTMDLPELSRLAGTTTQPLWLPADTHYAAAVRMPFADGGNVHLVLGLDKVFLTAQIQALRMALTAGLLLATLIILGFGLLYLTGTLSRPLERLLRGIEAVAGGRFVTVEGAGQADELGRVAAAFNTMAAKLDAEQRALRRLNAELEQRVEQRTAEMVRARDTAEAANRAKSVFLANMSHELRTPLNAILGFAQLMQQDRNLTGKQKNDIRTIDHSGQHLLGLINDVLEISRIESGRVTLDVKPFNLQSMIASVEEMIRVRADKQGLALRLQTADGLPDYVAGDEHRLRQILINLLGNAVKYTESGWVALRVNPETDSPVIRFEVEDSGPGIGAEDRLHVFEPFFQTEEAAAKGEGTGLGLAISRQYVALMEGELGLTSEPGRGSLFYFAIPLPKVAAPEAAEVSGERRVIGLEPGQRSYRILVVEDNEDNRQLLRRILESAGLTVREAVDGREALEKFKQWRPHLIWMDMRMPVMDGYEATRRIKAQSAGKDTVVIALTASAFEEDRSQVLAAGCDDFLRKPIRQSGIYAALERHLGLHFHYAAKEEEPIAMRDEDLMHGLARLPNEFRTALRAHALALDTRAIETSIQEIDALDSRLGKAMRRLLDDYRFDEMLELIEAVPDMTNTEEQPR